MREADSFLGPDAFHGVKLRSGGRGGAPLHKREVEFWVELFLWAAGLLIAAVLLITSLKAKSAMDSARRFGATPGVQTGGLVAGAQGASENPLPPGTPAQHGDGAVIGRLDIPKVGLSVPILENYDPASLKKGVGHIPGTANPGGLGNLGLAGHRDTFLRPVRNVKRGMEIDVVTAVGKYRYEVDTFEIVMPEQTEVLDIRGTPELTLITCYPFDFIGAAPKRFIVHAHLLSLDPG